MRNYSRTDASLTGWQLGMNALYQEIVDTTPAGEISDNSLEFKFDGENRRYMKRARLHTCLPLWQYYLHVCARVVMHWLNFSKTRRSATYEV